MHHGIRYTHDTEFYRTLSNFWEIARDQLTFTALCNLTVHSISIELNGLSEVSELFEHACDHYICKADFTQSTQAVWEACFMETFAAGHAKFCMLLF